MLKLASIVHAVYIWALWRYLVTGAKERLDLFSPDKIIILFYIFPTIGYIWYAFRPELITKETVSMVPVSDPEISFLIVILLSGIGVFFSVYGAKLSRPNKKLADSGKVIRTFFKNTDLNNSYMLGLIIFLLGVIGYLYFLNHVGGILFLWENLSLRSKLMGGAGYLLFFYSSFLVIGASLLYSSAKTYISRLFSFILMIFVVGLLVSLGGRGPGFLAIFTFFVFYNYKIKKISYVAIFSLRNFLLVPIIVIFTVVWVLLRPSGAFQHYMANLDYLWTDALESIETNFLSRVSSPYRQILIVSAFGPDRVLWGLDTHKDIIYSWIPRTLFPDKPPVDTGVYLTAIGAGWNVRPSMAAADLPAASTPEGNWIGYIGFWWPGYFTFCFLAGWLLSKIYIWMRLTNFHFLVVFLYAQCAYGAPPALTVSGITSLGLWLFLIIIIGVFINMLSVLRKMPSA